MGFLKGSSPFLRSFSRMHSFLRVLSRVPSKECMCKGRFAESSLLERTLLAFILSERALFCSSKRTCAATAKRRAFHAQNSWKYCMAGRWHYERSRRLRICVYFFLRAQYLDRSYPHIVYAYRARGCDILESVTNCWINIWIDNKRRKLIMKNHVWSIVWDSVTTCTIQLEDVVVLFKHCSSSPG